MSTHYYHLQDPNFDITRRDGINSESISINIYDGQISHNITLFAKNSEAINRLIEAMKTATKEVTK